MLTAALDAIELATIEGVLSAAPPVPAGPLSELSGGATLDASAGVEPSAAPGRELISLRLLPPATGASGEEPGLTARVVRSPAGELALHTALGMIAPRRPLAAVPGAELRVAIMSRQPLPAAASHAPDRAGGGASSGSIAGSQYPRNWGVAPHLRDPASVIAAVAERHLAPPSEHQRLALTLLFSAAPSAFVELSEAMTDPGRTLVPHNPGPDSTDTDFSTEQLVDGDNGQLWRVLPFLLSPPGYPPAHLLQREGLLSEIEPDETPARFVLDLAIGRLGPIQIDGLYRTARLDLILRSLRPLTGSTRENLRVRFHRALSAAGLSGGIVFVVARRFPVTAPSDASPLALDV